MTELRGKNILLVSPEPWDHIFVSKHHYAIHLGVRGNKVFFLGPPGNSDETEETQYNNVTHLKYKGFVKGLRFLPSLLAKRAIRSVYYKLQQLAGVTFDVVWSFDNSVFFDFSALPERVLKISHIVDMSQNFQTAKAASTANYAFAVTSNIKNKLLSFQPHTYFINHGYNYSEKEKRNQTLPGVNKFKAVYAGNLAISYLDWPLLLKATTENPNVDFILLGPGNEDHSTISREMRNSKEECLSCPNVYTPGRVNGDELLSWYKSADVLILVYDQEYQEELTNSHKMMEYLGSGKMIVATKTKEYIELAKRELIVMADQNVEYPKLLNEVVRQIESWNCELKQEKRKGFALNNTYEKQIERIERLILEKA